MWFVTMAFAQDCPTAAPLADLERAVIDGRAEEGARLAAEVEAAWGCGPVPAPEEVARLFLAEAVLAVLSGDDESVDLDLGAAARCSPDTWSDALGPALKERHEAAKAAAPGLGTLVADLPEGHAAQVDGRAVTPPAPVAEGLHLVVVVDGDGASVFSKIVHTSADETTRVPVTLRPPPAAPMPAPLVVAAPMPAPAVVPERGVRVPWVVAGATSLAAGAAFAGGALAQDGAMRSATTVEDLDAAFARQKAFAGLGYSFLGLSAVGFGVAFVP